ncbi:hypothetical protein N7532_011061 [Penicillium argentinense]|uniref:Mitogen-activated protein kinase mpkC n=1 Tax=Penicillium argentinense TaxID=1131581 RepID=A0A9W9JUE6_9EURO|nr:uncharacterized protein N7532_011061 [Penicillium argentinense]KAJ5082018.1 hypothetical protein N7532_011061 [Penicillium argentinense]
MHVYLVPAKMATFVTSELMGTTLEVTDRYTNLEPRGMGSSGMICSAHDSITNKTVAVKKIGKPFNHPILSKRTYREIHLLSNLRHDNLINLEDIFISPSEDLYLVMECVQTDLHYLMRSTPQPLEGKFIQFFAYQMLRGLQFIHTAGVVHRDLKPGNILVNDNCDLKICDFGLAREQDDLQMTGYVTTRYYRAPEVMLTWQHYTYAVDMWSVGCILTELVTGKVLFPGKDHVHQLTLIIELLGKPSKEAMNKIYSKNCLDFVNSLPDYPSSSLESTLGEADPKVVDLIGKMLDLDPKKRITTADALVHPYVSTYHDPEDEPVFDMKIDWSVLESDLSAEEWKTKMYSEVLGFHGGACDWQKPTNPGNKGIFENWLVDATTEGTY